MLPHIQLLGHDGQLGDVVDSMGEFYALGFLFSDNSMGFSVFQPKKEYLVWPVLLRVAFIPLFLLCNYHPLNIERIMPIYIQNDWIFWAIGISLGFSSGYLRYFINEIRLKSIQINSRLISVHWE